MIDGNLFKVKYNIHYSEQRLIMKICTRCGEEKPISEFRPGSRRCRLCLNELTAEYRANNPEKVKASQNKYRKTEKSKATQQRFLNKNPNYGAKAQRKHLAKMSEEQREEVKKRDREYKRKIQAETKAKFDALPEEEKKIKREQRQEWVRKYKNKNKETEAIANGLVPSRSKYLLGLLPVDATAIMTESGIECECKFCKKRFLPTRRDITLRTKVFRGVAGSLGSEYHLYCSETCKEACPIFKQRTRRKDQIPASARARSCQNDVLKQLQCDEFGYNFCEKCGDIIDVELHHTLPIAEFEDEAISSASHILMCVKCHTAKHSECKN